MVCTGEFLFTLVVRIPSYNWIASVPARLALPWAREDLPPMSQPDALFSAGPASNANAAPHCAVPASSGDT
jgi:hypothetical protein